MAVTQPQLFKTEARSAVFSDTRAYRYTLWRRWREGNAFVQFIGLNPSTADEHKDDNTIRKCVKFAKLWGFDALCMTNLFAFRATKPKEMLAHPFPIGWHNDRWIRNVAVDASMIIACWGQDGVHLGRSTAVSKLLSDFNIHCLKITGGEPHHPLYLRDDTKPFLWRKRGRIDR